MSYFKNLLDAPGITRPVEFQIIQCEKCGSKAHASCNCGAIYLPASTRAAEAIKANPEKSDRAIAADIGVSQPTVSKARKATDNGLSVDKRIGLDGKARRQPAKKAANELPSEEEAEASYQQTLYEQACSLLQSMASETRQRFFAHLRKTYAAQNDDGLDIPECLRRRTSAVS